MKKKKFVLVVIPSMENAYHGLQEFIAIHIPIGLTSIAAVLEGMGHQVTIIDGDAEGKNSEEIVEQIANEKPDFVGSTCMTATMDLTYNFYKILKKIIPNVKVMVGGPHVSVLAKQTLEESKDIDFVIRGEGEDTIVEILNSFESKSDFSKIPGIAYRNGKEIVTTNARPLISDLGKLPLPAFHLLKYDKYRSYGWNGWSSGNRKPLGVIFTGRGCYGQCNFCASQAIFGRKIRFFPIERIKEEIDLLVTKYNIKILYIEDDTFTANRRIVNKVCDFLIEKGYNKKLEIMVSTRPDKAHLPTFQKMRKAGIRWLCFGVESGNQEILDAMHKRTTIQDIENAFQMANKAGLFVAGNYMIGSLKETYDTAMDTIKFACKLKQDYASFAIAIPLPGTELYDYCMDENISLPTWNDFGSVNTPPIPINKGLDAKQLMELRSYATNRFFKRFSYFLRLLWRFNAIAILKDFLGIYFKLRKEIKDKRY